MHYQKECLRRNVLNILYLSYYFIRLLIIGTNTRHCNKNSYFLKILKTKNRVYSSSPPLLKSCRSVILLGSWRTWYWNYFYDQELMVISSLLYTKFHKCSNQVSSNSHCLILCMVHNKCTIVAQYIFFTLNKWMNEVNTTTYCKLEVCHPQIVTLILWD